MYMLMYAKSKQYLVIIVGMIILNYWASLFVSRHNSMSSKAMEGHSQLRIVIEGHGLETNSQTGI